MLTTALRSFTLSRSVSALNPAVNPLGDSRVKKQKE